ncbi:MAG TPA: M20 family metallopeptidase [Kribbella sp.]|uniref:M20 metallopeptidase family protein n=1 Tax=Kribbella sp. TaxID=1871183 RepID=UPI002D76C9EB|nr:M20 family metallopeptidase [Kribbella sp.]HET6294873.1 M20 family metallopeptidase [Kribbella sp.]
MTTSGTLGSDVAELAPEMTDLRHRLHRAPEIGLQLPRTQETLLEALSDLGLELTLGQSVTSITGVLRGGRSTGTAVLLRADMDALPVQERSGEPFSSEIDGAMHACGHDLHMAMLVGAARLLAEQRDALAGDIVFMFQPGEEGYDGAGAMIKEGVLTAAGPLVSAAYGMHVRSGKTPNGVFTTRGNTMMSSSSKLKVTVRGRGGHGSSPHFGRDPIAAAAEMITTLQTMVTRRFDIFDPVVVTVGAVAGGIASNVIPDTADFAATIRTFSTATGEKIGPLATAVCEGVAMAHGLEVDVEYVREYPATVNDPVHADFVADVVSEVFGPDQFVPMEFPEPGSEDFSRVLQAVPGSYMMLGAAVTDDLANAPSNHSPLARFDDRVMTRGAVLHAELAIRSLERSAAGAAAS